MGERGKIRLMASEAARKVHRRLKRKKQLGRGLSVEPETKLAMSVRFERSERRRNRPRVKDPEGIGLMPTGDLEQGLRDAITEAVKFLQEGTDRARQRRASLAVTANPRAYRDPGSGDQMRKRAEHAPHGFAREAINPNVSHLRVRTALDANARHFDDHEIAIARMFLSDFEAACASQRVTSQIYDGVQAGGGGSASGHLVEAQLIANARFRWVYETLDANWRYVADALLLEVTRDKSGRTITVDYVGGRASAYKGGDTKRAFGAGVMKGMLWRLSEAYTVWNWHNDRIRLIQRAQLRNKRASDDQRRQQQVPARDQPSAPSAGGWLLGAIGAEP